MVVSCTQSLNRSRIRATVRDLGLSGGVLYTIAQSLPDSSDGRSARCMQVDYSQISPVGYRKTVCLVNRSPMQHCPPSRIGRDQFVRSFVVNTVQFLNKFSSLCEEKLNKARLPSSRADRFTPFRAKSFFQVSQEIHRVEVSTAILEVRRTGLRLLTESVRTVGPAHYPSVALIDARPQR